ncbi:WD40-repeat-containing domain protein, partial [Ochromonadaceae sp. CCMP2298]
WYPRDSGAFVTASMGGQVSVYDTNLFRPVATFSLDTLYCAQMRDEEGGSPLIACALQDGSVRLCDPRTQDCSLSLRGHQMAVTRVDWSPRCPHLLASAGKDGACKVWDVRRAGRGVT